MKSCVKRILDQYEALKLYFTGIVVEDPTHNHDAILTSLNNKFMQVYLEFMDFNLGRFVSFNLLFQSEMPQLHKLKGEVDNLVKAMCLDFMDVQYVRSTDASKINPSRKENHLSLDKVLKVLLSLPFSNAAVERVFSQLKLIKTGHRASLKQESLLALLTTKMTLLKCDDHMDVPATINLEPSKEMLSLHKTMVTNVDNDEVTTLRKEFQLRTEDFVNKTLTA